MTRPHGSRQGRRSGGPFPGVRRSVSPPERDAARRDRRTTSRPVATRSRTSHANSRSSPRQRQRPSGESTPCGTVISPPQPGRCPGVDGGQTSHTHSTQG
jgi:hypothetical protein